MKIGKIKKIWRDLPRPLRIVLPKRQPEKGIPIEIPERVKVPLKQETK